MTARPNPGEHRRAREGALRPITSRLALFGTPVAVEADDDELRASLSWSLADLGLAEDAPRRLRVVERHGCFTLLDQGEVVRPGMSRDEALALVLWQLNRIAASSHSHAVLHAGCVALGGRGLAIVGASGAGKSTLVAALVRGGFSYLSDELVGCSVEDGLFWPHAVPMGLRRGAQDLLAPLPPGPLDPDGRLALRPADIGGATSGPVVPGAIIFIGHRGGGGRELEPLRPTPAFAELAGHALNLSEHPRAIVSALGRLVATTPAWRLTTREFDATSKALRAVLETT